ncbi:hypothetical protein EPUL_006159 [Erysiphe pulchra]|uniref:Uncharacterized protein n=1 Tax=Erysiphe pulchra TaxID=225359 RepID=A0A2S4PL52_9PEZI|nr:hypothetical protein EPUL_006159 [Erysiphe pulchra]
MKQLGLGQVTGHLEKALGLVIKRFAHEDNFLNDESRCAGYSDSIYATRQGQASSSKPSYTEAIKTYFPNTPKSNLPQKPSKPLPNYTTRTRKTDNRIFVRLPENHPSQAHHVHAVKTALVNKLGHEADENQAEQILKNSQVITSVRGGRVEKAEEWFTYVINHVPRKLTFLNGESWDFTEDDALAEAQSITGLLPTKIAWSKKTLANPLSSGTIVAHFKQATNPFRLSGTSSTARLIIKSPKPTQCPK